MRNTFKTLLGFVASVLEKYTPLQISGGKLEDTYNYLRIDDRIATSGQPTESQFRLIRDAGYTTVINLAPQSILENSLKTEAGLLNELGMQYIHIPVDFKQPTEHDFKEFVAVMQATAKQKVWVHCAANMRVSAFIYRYRCTVLSEDQQSAHIALLQIWEPVGVWRRFTSVRRSRTRSQERGRRGSP
ncbi:MAG: protein tyrosine phosphatase family protein [Thiolinea sp.]